MTRELTIMALGKDYPDRRLCMHCPDIYTGECTKGCVEKERSYEDERLCKRDDRVRRRRAQDIFEALGWPSRTPFRRHRKRHKKGPCKGTEGDA